jgi:tetratricopeptide (TPR) repeat protein
LFSRHLAILFLITGCAALLRAQNNTPVSIGHSETLFTVLAAINNCGYDAELGASDALRGKIRDEIGHQIEASQGAKEAADSICAFYRDHQRNDETHTLSQYVSLALYLNPAPDFKPKVRESDLPPDASSVLGLVPLLSKFYAQAGIHEIWQRHEPEYEELSSRYRDALAGMIRSTELYLRLPSGSYSGRTFTILIDPLGAPSEVNARTYANDYYVVITPGAKPGLKMDQVHHAYLHYLIDPQVGRFAANLTTFDPVLDTVKLAPMDENFKSDPVLLVTECVIRAIEARTLAGGKAPVSEQEQSVEASMSQGFVLTRYFYSRLQDFEKGEVGFRNAVGLMITQIDPHREGKQAGQIQFASAADPELLQLPKPKQGRLLISAQERLSAGDAEAAEKLAKQALAEKTEDPGRALFILAQISLNKNVAGAQQYFEQALQATNEPKVVAWSHIYLGRILDLQDDHENGPDRAEAIQHYKAAAGASDDLPEAKAAAELGLQKPFEPPKNAQGQSHQDDDKEKQ